MEKVTPNPPTGAKRSERKPDFLCSSATSGLLGLAPGVSAGASARARAGAGPAGAARGSPRRTGRSRRGRSGALPPPAPRRGGAVVAEEVEDVAVDAVGAGLGGGVEGAAGAGELRGVGVLLDAEFLEGIDGGLNPGAALMLFGDIDAVQKEGGLGAGTPLMTLPLIARENALDVASGGRRVTPGVMRPSSVNLRPLRGSSVICLVEMTWPRVADSVARRATSEVTWTSVVASPMRRSISTRAA